MNSIRPSVLNGHSKKIAGGAAGVTLAIVMYLIGQNSAAIASNAQVIERNREKVNEIAGVAVTVNRMDKTLVKICTHLQIQCQE